MSPPRKMFLEKSELIDHMEKYILELQQQGLSEDEIDRRIGIYYSNKVIRKYSKAEMDAMWAELYHLMTEVPGGYWQIIDNMDYMPVFEHPRFRSFKSEFGLK